jgi:hypothetical protein
MLYLHDISTALAHRAFRNTSHDPEGRGDRFRTDYAEHLAQVSDWLATFRNEANAGAMDAAFESYRAGYQSRAVTYLSASARCASAFITGPANFPVEQQRKRGEVADKRLNEWLTWGEQQRERLNRQFNPAAASAVIRSDADDALEQLRAKLEKLQAQQARMKAINKICRNTTTDADAKTAALAAMDCAATTIHTLLHPDYGPPGHPAWELANNNANIKRVRERLVALEAEHARRNVTPGEYDLGSAHVVENAAAERLQLFFDGKPAPEVIARLKTHGFKWSPRGGCWQRLLNANARVAVRNVMEA